MAILKSLMGLILNLATEKVGNFCVFFKDNCLHQNFRILGERSKLKGNHTLKNEINHNN